MGAIVTAAGHPLEELDPVVGLPGQKRMLLSLMEMEPLAKEATRNALGVYPEPLEEEHAQWQLGQCEATSPGF